MSKHGSITIEDDGNRMSQDFTPFNFQKIESQINLNKDSLKSQMRRSNIYIRDYSKVLNIDMNITDRLDLLNKADLKNQIVKL